MADDQTPPSDEQAEPPPDGRGSGQSPSPGPPSPDPPPSNPPVLGEGGAPPPTPPPGGDGPPSGFPSASAGSLFPSASSGSGGGYTSTSAGGHLASSSPGGPPPTTIGSIGSALLGVVRSPSATLRQVAASPNGPLALGLLVVIYIANGIALSLAGDPVPTFDVDPTTQALTPQPTFTAFTVAVVLPITGILTFSLWTLLLMGLSRLFGGRGSFTSLFCTLVFASAPPAIAALPLQAVPADRVILLLATMPLFLALAVWSIVLMVIAVREARGISTGAAVGTVVIAMVAALVLAFVAAFVLLALLFRAF